MSDQKKLALEYVRLLQTSGFLSAPLCATKELEEISVNAHVEALIGGGLRALEACKVPLSPSLALAETIDLKLFQQLIGASIWKGSITKGLAEQLFAIVTTGPGRVRGQNISVLRFLATTLWLLPPDTAINFDIPPLHDTITYIYAMTQPIVDPATNIEVTPIGREYFRGFMTRDAASAELLKMAEGAVLLRFAEPRVDKTDDGKDTVQYGRNVAASFYAVEANLSVQTEPTLVHSLVIGYDAVKKQICVNTFG